MLLNIPHLLFINHKLECHKELAAQNDNRHRNRVEPVGPGNQLLHPAGNCPDPDRV